MKNDTRGNAQELVYSLGMILVVWLKRGGDDYGDDHDDGGNTNNNANNISNSDSKSFVHTQCGIICGNNPPVNFGFHLYKYTFIYLYVCKKFISMVWM